MASHLFSIAFSLAAALSAAALAQPKASTPAGTTPDKPEAPALVRESSMPVVPSGGETRAEVKDDARAAAKAGEIPKGDAGISARHPKGGAAGTPRGPEAASPSRADVKAQARAAAKAGEIVKGEADFKTRP